MIRRIVAIVLVLMVGAEALAQPSTQPSRRPLGLREPDGDRGFRMRRPGTRGDAEDARLWEEAEAFFRAHSPNRLVMFDQHMDDPRMQYRMRRFMQERYTMLQNLKERDPNLYELKVKQIELEDVIFGLAQELRSTGDEAAREKLRGKIREQVVLWVDASLQEREQRLEKLKQLLADETKRLEADRNDREAMVERRLERVLSGGEVDGPEGGERGRRGEGPPPGSPGDLPPGEGHGDGPSDRGRDRPE
jgi:hypothetical protein